ncbi:hypothetical protein [Leucobacter luti]|uniref:hypothetical protein n=1 Tax=Leucobacter luti TaxID=340320 RepID=UPI001C68CED6|nr:hypothetical protein [Leucobacter luti]QYM76179.1 hypothetical protein K1X41_01425 [Leucobacter luti]
MAKSMTEATLKARHAKELEELREARRAECRDDRDEKHLAKWLRRHHYEEFRELAGRRDAEVAARRERTRSRVERHRAAADEPDVTHAVSERCTDEELTDETPSDGWLSGLPGRDSEHRSEA